MTPEEKAVREAMAQAEKKQRYNDAVDIVLAKQLELGHMPTEKDFKKDITVNFEQLIKDLGCKSFAEAVIKVLREQRKRQGQPANIIPRRKADLQKLKILDPEEYEKEMIRRETRKRRSSDDGSCMKSRDEEEREAKKKKAQEKKEQIRQMLTEGSILLQLTKKQKMEVKEMEQKVLQKEEIKEIEQKGTQESEMKEVEQKEPQRETKETKQDGAQKKYKRREYRRWTDIEIAIVVEGIVEEYGRYPTDAELSCGEINNKPIKGGTPSPMTVRRALGGSRNEWADSIERILGCKLDVMSKPKNEIVQTKKEHENVATKKEISHEENHENYQTLDFKDFSEEVKKCLQIIDDGSLAKVSEVVEIDVKMKICTQNISGTRINCYFILQTEE